MDGGDDEDVGRREGGPQLGVTDMAPEGHGPVQSHVGGEAVQGGVVRLLRRLADDGQRRLTDRGAPASPPVP